jgi:MYXO-CTERM domain-containing protein
VDDLSYVQVPTPGALALLGLGGLALVRRRRA